MRICQAKLASSSFSRTTPSARTLCTSNRTSRNASQDRLSGETLAFVDGFDNAYLLRHELERMLGQPIPLIMFTDSQALFNVLTRNKTTTERRLMVDVAAAMQAYHSNKFSNVGLITSYHNPADGLTKVGCNPALAGLLCTHSIDHLVE
jgi:hypothetical protein